MTCFPILIPTQRGPTLPTMKSFIWRHANACMKVVVVCELYQGQNFIPSTQVIQHARSQKILKRLVCSLRLTIGLG